MGIGVHLKVTFDYDSFKCNSCSDFLMVETLFITLCNTLVAILYIMKS